MQGPRSPEANELDKLYKFLNENLRQNAPWAINQEYPTALNPQNLHNMSIIESDEKIVSHAVIKPIITKTPFAIFKLGAIGSVVTDPNFRNQGFSSLNMQNCLAKASAQSCDLVILWTDQYEFYQKFGFELAGVECSYQLNQPLPIENKEAKFIKGPQIDAQAILKLYHQHTVCGMRTTEDIQKFLRIPNSNIYTMWSQQNQLLAYAVEGKGIDLTNYVHEWGGDVGSLMDLLSYMIHLENKSYTVIAPFHAVNFRRKLDQLSPSEHRGFLGMIRIQDFESVAQKVKKAFRSEGLDQIILEKQHGEIVFGYGRDLYTLSHEADLVRILFGPVLPTQLDFMKPETQQVLAKLLPLPLWVWGWDSI